MEAKELIYSWCDMLPNGGELRITSGNHEARLEKFILNNATPITELVNTIPELLGLKQIKRVKAVWYPHDIWDACKIGGVVFTHGFYYNKHLAVTNLERYQCSVVHGHSHRVQYAANGKYFSASLGHGSNESLTTHSPSPSWWQQAYGIFTVGHGLEMYLVNDGETLCRGKFFSCN